MDARFRQRPSKKTLSLLLAEDDDVLRDSLTAFFLSQGFRVCPARSGTEAVEIAVVERVSFSVMDVHMPGLTGIEALESISSKMGFLPCIFMSGDASDDIMMKALAAGGVSFLSKPIHIELMRESVDRLIDRYFRGK